MSGRLTIKSDRDLYAHPLAWDLHAALETRKDWRAKKLLRRILGRGIDQAADIWLDPWRTPEGLADLRAQIEAAQGPRRH